MREGKALWKNRTVTSPTSIARAPAPSPLTDRPASPSCSLTATTFTFKSRLARTTRSIGLGCFVLRRWQREEDGLGTIPADYDQDGAAQGAGVEAQAI